MSEKLFWGLLSLAFDRCVDGDSSTRKLLVERASECMRSTILGDTSSGRMTQWKFPLSDSGTKVVPRSMTNAHARRCVLGIKTLATTVFGSDLDENDGSPAETRERNKRMEKHWHQLMDVFMPMMEMLRQREDFTDEEIDEMHKLTSSFMRKWVDMMGARNITNCIHMVGSGHLHCYLKLHRNLCKFSQQGWEALNQKLKHCHFNNTNHGGCLGNKNSGMVSGEHALPLLKLCQRSAMCKLGLGEVFFAGGATEEGSSVEDAGDGLMETGKL